MASFENTVIIQRPVEEVFAFLADFENLPKWNYAIVETTKTSPGPVGVGTTYYQTRSIPTRSDERFQVTAFEPARRLEIHGQIGPFHARNRPTAGQGFATPWTLSPRVRWPWLRRWPPPASSTRWRPTSTHSSNS